MTIFWNYVTWQLPATVSHLFLHFNALTCFRYFSQFKKWWSLSSSRANWWKGWQGLFEVFNVRTLFVSAVHTAPKSALNRTFSKRGKNKEVAQSCRRVCLLCFYHILTSSVIFYCTDPRQNGIYLFYQKQMLLVLYNDQKRKKKTNTHKKLTCLVPLDCSRICASLCIL